MRPFLYATAKVLIMKNIRDEYDFVGWVPCISGYLLFEYTCCVLAENDDEVYSEINHLELDVDDKECRHIIVSSGVNWKDGKTHLKGRYRVVLLASVPMKAEQLEGQVYIIPRDNNEWEKGCITEDLCSLNELTLKGEDIKAKFADLKNKLDAIQSDKVFITNFKLIRSGFLFLRYNKKNSLPKWETSAVIARQSYYYVKYTFHKHAHHDKSAESLTTTFSLPDDNLAIGILLSNDLKRSLVQLKRDFNGSNYRLLLQAKGIVSYAKSLLLSCKKENFISKDQYADEKAYIENLGESLEVTAKKIENQIATDEKISSNFRAILIFCLAIIAPITLIFREEVIKRMGSHQPTHIIEIIGQVAQSDQFIFTLAILTIVVFLAYRMMVINFGSLPLAVKGLHRLIEFIVLSKRRAKVIICTLWVLILLSFYLFWIKL